MAQKILVTGNLPGEVMDLLTEQFEVKSQSEDQPLDRRDLLAFIGDRDGLLSMITDAVDGELLSRAPKLKMIANMGVGYNNIDVAAATRRGIPVSNTPGVLTDATADLAFTLIPSVARRVVEGDKRVRTGQFTFWAPFLFLGREVSGKTLGIIGLGRIGRAVAQRARAFNMRILYHNRQRLKPAEETALQIEYVPLDRLLAEADFVSLHIPLMNETRHFIGPRELALMKPAAYLINTSRGPVVDEKALLAALQDKEIAGAGLDVYEQEPVLTPGLTKLDNVVLLPHVGSATLETRTRMADMAARNLIAGLGGKIPPNLVNPEVYPDK